MEPYLYASAQLHPWELRRYTLRELGALMDGLRVREDRSWWRLAQLACWLINPHMSRRQKKVKPEALMGRRPYQGGGEDDGA
jgi:hypothetical protein